MHLHSLRPDSMLYTTHPSPIGELVLATNGQALATILFPTEQRGHPQPGWRRDDALFAHARAQLDAYFAGELRTFDLALDLAGTPFQCAVWEALLDIPYGETTSYGALATRIGRPKASRAVGSANGSNPLPIVVPCHRVIGANGDLTGFGGGLPIKRWLLRHEGALPGTRELF
ncbi:MAG: methylated-DNA--[protein]-cysteine S-methyltransferase [Gammaproteobacteria bacterium]